MDEPRQSLDPPSEGFGSVSPRDLDSIGATFSRYALATDTADGEMLKCTFVPQAVFVGRSGSAAAALEVRGSSEIARYVVNTRLQHAYSERHFITNLLVERLSPRSARAHAYFLVTRIEGDAVIHSATGSYEADLVHGEDRVWRISRMYVHTDLALQ